MRADLEMIDPQAANMVHRCVVGDMLTRTSRTFPHRRALVDRDVTLTYRELEDVANSVAQGLGAVGLTRQEPVGFMMRNHWKFVATFFGCAKAGLVSLPVNIALSPQEIAFIINDAKVRALVIDSEFLPVLDEIRDQLSFVQWLILTDGDGLRSTLDGLQAIAWSTVVENEGAPPQAIVEDRDIVHCLYTSGTTSLPKGVLTGHVSVVVSSLSTALQMGHRWGEDPSTMIVVLPLFHITALDTLLLPVLATGGTAILHQKFDAAEMLHSIEREKATHFMLIPIMYAELLDRLTSSPEFDLASVRQCIYGMAPMPVERIAEIRSAFPAADVLLGSGQTECVPPTVYQWPSHQFDKSHSWGSPVITTEVQIMRSDGTIAGLGEEGEIVYRGPHVMEGYWNNAQANTEAFAYGWFHSGDVGFIDDGGVVWFTDRVKDIVKTGGENVSSIEVERVLLAHPAVVECAVVGKAHPRWGEAVTAVVVVSNTSQTNQAELIMHCRQRLAGFKVPKSIEFRSSLPKTATGKVQKHVLR